MEEQFSEYRVILSAAGYDLRTWALYHFDDDGVGRFLAADELAPFETMTGILSRILGEIKSDLKLRAKLR